MNKKNRFAPVLHTGFFEKYNDGIVERYVKYCADMGYSGISLEGKSWAPQRDVDAWIESYRDNVKKITDAAQREGIDVWLFDEWGYPTGTAAGKVISESRGYASKYMHIILNTVIAPGETFVMPVNGRFICAAVWECGRYGAGAGSFKGYVAIEPVNGVIAYTATEAEMCITAVGWDYTSGGTHGVFKDDGSAKFGTIDLLSKDAVACFIEHMHEGYYKHMPEQFGTGLAGFFYDEPFIPYPYPYTDGILDEFYKRYGYDLTEHLPRLLISGWGGRDTEQALTDYRELVTDMMAQNCVGQLARWCHEHKVMLTGHQDLDHNLRGLDTISGNFFKNSILSDSPGVDYIWNQINRSDFCDYPRFAGSVRHLCNKPHASSESFAVTGYSMPPDEMRWHMEHQIIRGIDLFYLMIAEPDETEQREYTKLSLNNPQNIRFGKLINARVAEVNRLASAGIPCADTAVYVPVKQAFVEGLKAGHPWSASTMPHIWNRVDAIAETVCYMPRAFEYIWDGAIESLDLNNGAFVTRSGQRISTIILTGGISIPTPVIRRLRDFARSGGKLIIVGGMTAGFADICKTYPASGCALLVRDTAELARCLKNNGFSSKSRISMAVNKTETGKVFFMLNESDTEARLRLDTPLFEYSFTRHAFDIAPFSGEAEFASGELRVFAERGMGGYAGYESIKANAGLVIENWIMYCPDGSARNVGNALPQWREHIEEGFSGGITFKAEFDISDSGRYVMDFGRIRYSAVVKVDGTEHALPFSPFRLETDLKKGRHGIEMTIYNTEADSLIGTHELEMKNRRGLRCYEHDRFMLGGGFADPVRIYRRIQISEPQN